MLAVVCQVVTYIRVSNYDKQLNSVIVYHCFYKLEYLEHCFFRINGKLYIIAIDMI